MTSSILVDKLNKLKNDLSYLEGQDAFICKSYNACKIEDKKLNEEIESYRKAVEVLTLIQKDSQESIKEKFELTVTSFVRYVTEDESYDFKIVFDRKGNIPTAEFRLKSPTSNEEYLPISECSGGGISDILSVGIRIIVMNFLNAEPLIMLDEVFSALSENYQNKAVEFIKKLASDLDYQVILITHREIEREAGNVIEIRGD